MSKSKVITKLGDLIDNCFNVVGTLLLCALILGGLVGIGVQAIESDLYVKYNSTKLLDLKKQVDELDRKLFENSL